MELFVARPPYLESKKYTVLSHSSKFKTLITAVPKRCILSFNQFIPFNSVFNIKNGNTKQ